MGTSSRKTRSSSDKPVAFTSTWTAVMPVLYRLVYHTNYDYAHAELDEWYTLQRKRLTLFKKRVKWVPVKTGAGEYSFPVRGDFGWAERIARDLDIELPMPTHRLSQFKAEQVRSGTNHRAKTAVVGRKPGGTIKENR